MSQIQESYITGIPGTGVTKALQNTRQAVIVDDTKSATRGNPAIPVLPVSGTNNAFEVLGEYKHWQSDTAIRVQTTGILHLEAKAAYAIAQNGHGVVSSDVDGKVAPGAAVGVGFGRIIGGYTENGKHYLIVYKS